MSYRSSWLAAAAFAVCGGLSAAGASGAVVFQADFKGAGGGSGGVSDIATAGGSGSLITSRDYTSTVVTDAAQSMGSGGFLRVSSGSTAYGDNTTLNSGAAMTPTSRQNSFDSWIKTGTASGGAAYVGLNGAVDFFYRSSMALDSKTVGNNEIRVIDTSWGGSSSTPLRLILNSNNANRMLLNLIVNTPDGAGADYDSYVASSSTLTLAANTVYHFAITATTDVTTGFVTIKLFVAQGNTEIDTDSTSAIATLSMSKLIDPAVTKNASFFETANTNGQFRFGKLRSGTTNETNQTFDFDSLRLYDSAPANFAAMPVPEVATAGLIFSGGIAAGLLRRGK